MATTVVVAIFTACLFGTARMINGRGYRLSTFGRDLLLGIIIFLLIMLVGEMALQFGLIGN